MNVIKELRGVVESLVGKPAHQHKFERTGELLGWPVITCRKCGLEEVTGW